MGRGGDCSVDDGDGDDNFEFLCAAWLGAWQWRAIRVLRLGPTTGQHQPIQPVQARQTIRSCLSHAADISVLRVVSRVLHQSCGELASG